MGVQKDMDSMHPIREEFDRYLQGTLECARRQQVEKHLLDCNFCAELVKNLKLRQKFSSHSLTEDMPPNLEEVADRLFDLSLRGTLIELTLLERHSTGPSSLMAADGLSREDMGVENLATVYSENPEIVLRLMRDNKAGQCYVQVVSDDPALYENMLVELPDIGRSVITDKNGRAQIDDIDPDQISDMRWRIRLPDVVFDLESLTFDPNQTEYRKETILESKQGDRIRVSLEGMGDGKQIELEVLQLDGSAKIGRLHMVVSVDDDIQRFSLEGKKSVVIETGSLPGKIRIRLYT